MGIHYTPLHSLKRSRFINFVFHYFMAFQQLLKTIMAVK